MVDIVFDFNQNKINIQSQLNVLFQVVIDKYLQKSSIAPNSVFFIAHGKQIDSKKTVESQMDIYDKQNKKMLVLVTSSEKDDKNEEKVIIRSKDIICPKCGEPCLFKLRENGRIDLFDCINKHTIKGIKILDFNKSQKINISEIKCDQCKIKNKGNSHNHEFYICLTCKQNLCPLCKSSHNRNHFIINYEQKNYICSKHNEVFIKYCQECSSNICFSCDEKHIKHKTISLVDIKPDLESSKKRLEGIKLQIDNLKKEIKEIINKLNGLMEIMNAYYEISKIFWTIMK